jgi:hypothetical protein
MEQQLAAERQSQQLALERQSQQLAAERQQMAAERQQQLALSQQQSLALIANSQRAQANVAAPVITINASSNNNLSNTTTVGSGANAVSESKPSEMDDVAWTLQWIEEVVVMVDRWRPDVRYIANFLISSATFSEPNWDISSITHPRHEHALHVAPPVSFRCDLCINQVAGKHYACQACRWHICWACTHKHGVMQECLNMLKEINKQVAFYDSNSWWYALRALCYTMLSWLEGRKADDKEVREITQKASANMKRAVELSRGTPALLNLYATTAVNLGYNRGVDFLNDALKWSTTAVEQEKDPDKKMQYAKTEQLVRDVIGIRDAPPPLPPPPIELCCCCTIQ